MKKKENTHLTPSEKKALHYIIAHGPTYAYHLSHTTPKILETEKTANIALNSLARKGYLRKTATKAERTQGWVTERKMYSLTLKGLCKALADSDQLWQDIDKNAQKWSIWLPILDYYDVFEKHDVLGDFKKRLKTAIKSVVSQNERILDIPIVSLDALMLEFTNNLLTAICFKQDLEAKHDYVVFGKAFPNSIDQLRDLWFQVLREETELRQYVESVIQRNLEDKRRELKIQEARLSFLNGLEKQ